MANADDNVMRNNSFQQTELGVAEYMLDDEKIDLLMKFLKDEKEIYARILDLELKKRDAIFNTNSERLNDITRMEEIEAERLDENESILIHAVAEIRSSYNLPQDSGLTEILSRTGNKDIQQLIKKKEELTNIINQVKSANKMNSLLLNESKDFFHHMIESVSKENDISYNESGKENHHRKSIFINVTG